MKTFTKKAYYSTKRFVSNHKISLTVAATVPLYIWLHNKSVEDLTGFIKEKGLWEEFITPED